MDAEIAKTFEERQCEIDETLVSIAKRKLAVEEQLKELKDEEKALKKKQVALWSEEYGPNMSFFDIWDRENEEEKKK